MMPATGLRRISVSSKRCLRNSGSCFSPNMTELSAVRRDFHAVEAEVVLAARVGPVAHVLEVALHLAAIQARVVGDDKGALDEARLQGLQVVEVVFLLRVDEYEVDGP